MKIQVKTRSAEDAGQLVKFLKTIQYLSSIGASRELIMIVDGDGSADMKFEFSEVTGADEINPVKEIDKPMKFYIGE